MTATKRLAGAWALLVTVTLISFFVAEHFYVGVLSIAVVMAIAGFKVRLVLYHFMELGVLPLGFWLFFNAWIIVCSAFIFSLYWYGLTLNS